MRKLLLVLLVCLSGCQLKTGISDILNNTGIQKLNNRKYQDAIDDFTKAIAVDPDNPLPYSNRGFAKYNLKDYKGAIADYRKAISIKHDLIATLKNMIIATDMAKEYDTSICYCDKIIKIQPNNGAVISFRGDMKYQLKDYDGAITDFTSALDAVNDDTGKHNYILFSYMERSMARSHIYDYHGAVKDIDFALLIEPNNVHALTDKGAFEYHLNEYDTATEVLHKALDINPGFAKAHLYLGMINIKKGNKQMGCNELNKAANYGFIGGQDTIAKYCK